MVYYWYTFNGGPVGDFAKLKQLLDSYGPQGMELVTISLDGSAKEAAEFVKKASAPARTCTRTAAWTASTPWTTA